MAELINGSDCLDAWQLAARHLLDVGDCDNLIVEIDDPGLRQPQWFTAHNPRRIVAAARSCADIALTIWPAKLAARFAIREDLYDAYSERYERGHRLRRNRATWGTYCLRLIASGPERINQVERAISCIMRWRRRSKTAFVFHIGTPTDNPRIRGGPCLQYVELIWRHDDVIDMVAIFRNHDYFHKAFGNFVGLSDLLLFICNQSGKKPGKLTIHSVHAFYDRSRRQFERLIDGT